MSQAVNIPAPASREQPRIAGLFTPEALLMLGLLLAAFYGLFFRWFKVQNFVSSTEVEDWGHAYFIPVISGYLVYRHRDELRLLKPRVFWPGLAPLLLGIMSYFMGVVGIKNHMFQGFAIILTILGLAILLLGPSFIRYVFLPIVFLVFAVTISQRIMIELTFPLQLTASQGGYFVLSLIGAASGFSAEVSGNLITIVDRNGMPHELDIAAACSGMRMVVAFFALAAATALLGCRLWWQRVALVLLAAPVAIIINVGRVSVLGLLSLADSNLTMGEAHMFIGMLLLIPGLGLFMLVLWALKKVVGERETKA
jgi:exosortase